MDKPRPRTTKGVPWGDHNATESSPPDRRPPDSDDADRIPDEKPRPDSDSIERESYEDVERERDV